MCIEWTLYDHVAEGGDPNVKILALINDVEVWVSGSEWVDLKLEFEDSTIIEFEVPHEVAIYYDEDGFLMADYIPDAVPEEWTS